MIDLTAAPLDIPPDVLAELSRPWMGGELRRHVRVEAVFSQRVRLFGVDGEAHIVRFVDTDQIDDVDAFVEEIGVLICYY